MTSKSSKNRIDGFFVPRRRNPDIKPGRPSLDSLHSSSDIAEGGLRLQRRQATPLGSNEMKDYFQVPGAEKTTTSAAPAPLEAPHKEKQKKGFKFPRFHKPTKKTVKRSLIVLAVLLLLFVVFFIVRFFLASGQVFKGNVFNAVFSRGKPLKTDENGRSNVLLFGTSEDDPGHPGAHLADSIMVASIDQKKKEVFLVSIPRDLNVKYERACIPGYEGKVNVVYECFAGENVSDEDAGQAAMRDKVGEVLGLDLQYSVHVNYSALKQAVDAVGGITVLIESDHPQGIYERYVKLPNGPAKLNGEAALALARARNAEGGYGLSRSNFDREQYQQKILVALKDRAASAGTLANPVAVNGLIDALGNNVRTNFDAEEIKTLAKLGQDIKNEKIKRVDLNTEENMLLDGNGQPTAGEYDFSQIQAFIRALASGDTSYMEGAMVDVLNASGQAGVAQEKADELIAKGIVVEVIGNAPTSLNRGGTQLYDVSNGSKPGTLKKLEAILGTKAIKQMPAGVTSNSDFVIIVGSNGAS